MHPEFGTISSCPSREGEGWSRSPVPVVVSDVYFPPRRRPWSTFRCRPRGSSPLFVGRLRCPSLPIPAPKLAPSSAAHEERCSGKSSSEPVDLFARDEIVGGAGLLVFLMSEGGATRAWSALRRFPCWSCCRHVLSCAWSILFPRVFLRQAKQEQGPGLPALN